MRAITRSPCNGTNKKNRHTYTQQTYLAKALDVSPEGAAVSGHVSYRFAFHLRCNPFVVSAPVLLTSTQVLAIVVLGPRIKPYEK